MKKYVYNFFHLNIAYSAIEEIDRKQVIKKCYWPLLNLIRELDINAGIELSGYTLEVINQLDPTWPNELKRLIDSGQCELIGCGYAQVIGPLVPHEVTCKNLKIGQSVYKKILGKTPNIALLNEQAYSKGQIKNYKDAGFNSIIVEWNNAFMLNNHWDQQLQFYPQKVVDDLGNEINVIWNETFMFQKFQRYAHGEIGVEDFIDFIQSRHMTANGGMLLYGNDVEIFDYRPGRYMTESVIHQAGEWERIKLLYEKLLKMNFKFVKPSEVLGFYDGQHSGNVLSPTTAAQQIIVKKQPKYNVSRWAVSGRGDININTKCWQIFESLNSSRTCNEKNWKELCFLWSSDFRTHITDERWRKYLQRLKDFHQQTCQPEAKITNGFVGKPTKNFLSNVTKCPRYLNFDGDHIAVGFDLAKGMAISSLVDKRVGTESIFGTVEHSELADIRFGADFYSGNLVFHPPGMHKLSDLVSVEPEVISLSHGIELSAQIKVGPLVLRKCWTIDDVAGRLELSYKIRSCSPILGSLRFNAITTLNDGAKFEIESHNGGPDLEKFQCAEGVVIGKILSPLISCDGVLGITEGKINLGLPSTTLRMKLDKAKCAAVGLYEHYIFEQRSLSRLFFGILETDDTAKPVVLDDLELRLTYETQTK